jgi:hypothetical protein
MNNLESLALRGNVRRWIKEHNVDKDKVVEFCSADGRIGRYSKLGHILERNTEEKLLISNFTIGCFIIRCVEIKDYYLSDHHVNNRAKILSREYAEDYEQYIKSKIKCKNRYWFVIHMNSLTAGYSTVIGEYHLEVCRNIGISKDLYRNKLDTMMAVSMTHVFTYEQLIRWLPSVINLEKEYKKQKKAPIFGASPEYKIPDSNKLIPSYNNTIKINNIMNNARDLALDIAAEEIRIISLVGDLHQSLYETEWYCGTSTIEGLFVKYFDRILADIEANKNILFPQFMIRSDNDIRLIGCFLGYQLRLWIENIRHWNSYLLEHLEYVDYTEQFQYKILLIFRLMINGQSESKRVIWNDVASTLDKPIGIKGVMGIIKSYF